MQNLTLQIRYKRVAEFLERKGYSSHHHPSRAQLAKLASPGAIHLSMSASTVFNFFYLYSITKTKLMKKLLSLIFLCLLMLQSTNAQIALPNPGFENWTSQGLYEDPDNWNTLNPSTAVLGILTALKATGADVYSGNNAIKLITKNVLGQTANGIATTGTINTGNQTITGGIPYTDRPDSITGWYKCTPVGGDNGFLAFVLLDAVEDTIGFSRFTTPTTTVGVYTYFSSAITYYSSASPVTARCLLSSSAGFTATVNSTLFMDDLALIFNSTGIKEELPGRATSVHFNSASRQLIVKAPMANITKAEIMDLKGSTLTTYAIYGVNSEVEIQSISAGIYFVVLSDESKKIVSIKKILID